MFAAGHCWSQWGSAQAVQLPSGTELMAVLGLQGAGRGIWYQNSLERSKKTNGTEEQQEEWNRDYSEVRGVPHLMPGVASVLPFIHRDGCISISNVRLAKAASEGGGFEGRA